MPNAGSPPPPRPPWRTFGLALGVVVPGLLLGWFLTRPTAPKPLIANPPSAVAAAHSALKTAQAAPAHPVSASVPPGTLISPQEVLSQMGHWIGEHPNCHSVIQTALAGGNVLSTLDLFTYTNGAAGEIVKLKANIFLPQPLSFQAQNEKGKLQVYFPRSDVLIEPSLQAMMLSLPSLAADPSGVNALLKLATNTFAEASADLRVVTLVLDPERLNLPFMSDEIYLSFRTDSLGKLLSIEEQAQGRRVVSTFRYVTFDKDLVRRTAPAFPEGKTPTSGKTLQEAMQDEIRQSLNKPLRTKI